MTSNLSFFRPLNVPYRFVAHNTESGERTKDIHISENVDFSYFALSSSVMDGLNVCGFVKPSPIQFQAIPLGKSGVDLIMQAKSGTGKTCVFAVLSLETVSVNLSHPQVLILAPTREVAVQITEVISEIGCSVRGIKVECFIGGKSVDQDVQKAGNCHIAVGTPGRIKQLMESTHLDIGLIKLFVLDEADELLSECWASDTQYIREQISSRTQMIASSSTFPDYVKNQLDSFLQSPIHVCPESDETILHGVRQFVMRVKFHHDPHIQQNIKARQLINILSAIPFKQCIVFSNYQPRAQEMCNLLSSKDWPAKWIGSLQDQRTRFETMDNFHEGHCSVLLSTDLIARGIDVKNVNLVINFDVPQNGITYLHRIGRSGRYGSYGIAVTLVDETEELPKFQQMLRSVSGSSFSVALLPPESLSAELWACDISSFEQINDVEHADKETSVPLVEEGEEMLSIENTNDKQVILHNGKKFFDKMEKCGKEYLAETKTNLVKKHDELNSRDEKYCNGKETFEKGTRPLIEEETILKNKSRSVLMMNETSKGKEATEEQKEEIVAISKKEHESADAEGNLLSGISASISKYVEKADEDKLLFAAIPAWYSKYLITMPVERKSKRKNSNDFDYDDCLSDYLSGDTEKSVSGQDDYSEGENSDNDDRKSEGEDVLEDTGSEDEMEESESEDEMEESESEDEMEESESEDEMEESESEDEMEESESEDEEEATSQQYHYTLPSLEYPVNSSVNHEDYTQEDASHTEGLPDCVPECACPYLKYANWRKEMLKVKNRIKNTEYMKHVPPYYHN